MAPGPSAKWASHKLECLAEYIQDYAASLKNGGCYLELFAGTSGPDGIEARVLKARDKFSRCIFVVRDAESAKTLAEITSPLDSAKTVNIISGNCVHETVMRQVFDLIPRSTASFALIDPPGYIALRWSVIKKLALHGTDWKGHKTDLLIIFPLEMALLRNLTRKECENSINRLYGNSTWQAIRQKRMDNQMGLDKVRKELVELFKANLKSLDYKHVEDAEPARFSNPPYYHVIWASDRFSRLKELKEAWGRERYLPGELFHEGDNAGK
jgi:three-Cys-motif partner protein